MIFHYLKGDTNSIAPDYRILKTDTPQVPLNGLPERITGVLQSQGIQDVQYFEAYCKAEKSSCNYFTHTWSMDKMVENRRTIVSSGMYNPTNLTPNQDQIGMNDLVQQTMSFHDGEYLSGNAARFSINDMNQVADAWFLSIYDPDYNRYNPNDPNNTYNADVNQTKKAIIVHWYIIPINVPIDAVTENQRLQEVLRDWDVGDVIENLVPQFTPQQ